MFACHWCSAIWTLRSASLKPCKHVLFILLFGRVFSIPLWCWSIYCLSSSRYWCCWPWRCLHWPVWTWSSADPAGVASCSFSFLWLVCFETRSSPVNHRVKMIRLIEQTMRLLAVPDTSCVSCINVTYAKQVY